jgi:small subunit ribosomal protein S13
LDTKPESKDEKAEKTENVEEKSPDQTKEKSTKEQPEEIKTEEKPEEIIKEKKETSAEPEKVEEKKEKKPVETEGQKEIKKEESKKKDGKKSDFKYIVRIANTDIDGDKTVIQGLTSIKGIGSRLSVLVVDETGIDGYLKMGDLKDNQIEIIKKVLESINEKAPGWMLNHRKDYDTGEDIHLVGPDIDLKLRDEINMMKKIRSYRGIRHETGLRVRGQRTRANNREGLSLGVSKKSAQKGGTSKSD